MNEEYPSEAVEIISWNNCLIGQVYEEKVKATMMVVKKTKAIGQDGLFAEVCNILQESKHWMIKSYF